MDDGCSDVVQVQPGPGWREHTIPPRHAQVWVRLRGIWRKGHITAWIKDPGSTRRLGLPDPRGRASRPPVERALSLRLTVNPAPLRRHPADRLRQPAVICRRVLRVKGAAPRLVGGLRITPSEPVCAQDAIFAAVGGQTSFLRRLLRSVIDSIGPRGAHSARNADYARCVDCSLVAVGQCRTASSGAVCAFCFLLD
jgi:hypothetical protein